MKYSKLLALPLAASLMIGGFSVSAIAESQNVAVEAEVTQIVYESDPTPMYAEGGEDGDLICNRQQILTILDDTTAIVKDSWIYGNGYASISEYRGLYERTGENTIKFTFSSESDNTIFEFTLDEAAGKITDTQMTYGYESNMDDIAGVYKGSDEVYGNMELTITENGSASMTTEDGKTFGGSVYYFNENLEFTGYYEPEGEEYEYIDWFLTLEGDTFTYVTYNKFNYGMYEGSYTAVGDLGEITFVVNEEGKVVFSVNIDGQEYNFTGSIYSDNEENRITGMYVNNGEGYSMDLALVDLGDGTLNYSGYFTRPLAAG